MEKTSLKPPAIYCIYTYIFIYHISYQIMSFHTHCQFWSTYGATNKTFEDLTNFLTARVLPVWVIPSLSGSPSHPQDFNVNSILLDSVDKWGRKNPKQLLESYFFEKKQLVTFLPSHTCPMFHQLGFINPGLPEETTLRQRHAMPPCDPFVEAKISMGIRLHKVRHPWLARKSIKISRRPDISSHIQPGGFNQI